MTRNAKDDLQSDQRSEPDQQSASDELSERKLKRGWTTGACAAAATKAAYLGFLTGRFPDPVQITLPKGERPSFDLVESRRCDQAARAAIEKDAGDDPDVTHGAIITAKVCRGDPGNGVIFIAGEGVGVVTLPGLPIAVGEPAINPGPRKLIRSLIAEIAHAHGDGGDLEVTISIPGGEVLAKKTANERLGIVGGLSVLGTTGVVIPYSCSAWIASIHRGIDVARATGYEHVAAATGSTSERAVRDFYGLPDQALIEMGDFVGGTLKYLRRHPIPKVTLAGGFAKISKLADGHLNLHSKRSEVDLDGLADLLAMRGASGELLDQVRSARIASRVLELASAAALPLADDVAENARAFVLDQVDGRAEIEVMVFDRAGGLAGRARGWA
ncbi:MAG: cobalt-precorrin-5B (C(1))-methyltransferase [Alphaproteobacteria bacterium]|nr:cobalt-precorrin-5B (C(1))-methyltransferase [Alphaproteobacteria bacterium]